MMSFLNTTSKHEDINPLMVETIHDEVYNKTLINVIHIRCDDTVVGGIYVRDTGLSSKPPTERHITQDVKKTENNMF